ncbi:Condensin complex subunit 1 [Geodia barretti]|uniref:Condensin complex subunit 1 n=1 Tax=Geodia barretti TaxID=519541 RepID=A0AA35WYJ0_GEOBA|nr:Condensin complex subunit 1 [Geodia barretti]
MFARHPAFSPSLKLFNIIHPDLSYIVLPFLLCGLFDNARVGHPIFCLECRSLLDSSVVASIPECFPVFFSLLQNFLSVGVSVRESYWRIGVRGLEGVCHQVGGANFTGMTQTKKAELRNALKMMVYVVVQMVEEFETDATKPDSLDIVTNKRGGKKKKKNAVTGSESHPSGMDWGRERERVVEMTSDLVENDLWLLWEPPSVQMMEDFSNLLLSLCYKLLENPGFVREKTARDKVFGLMGSLMKRFNVALGVGMKIPQLLQHFEHLTSPLAVAMSSWTQEYGVKTVVSEVVRELGRKDPRDLSQDTSGTRCFASFLVELSQLVPAAVLPSISVLIPHLSGESYTMRNGVLGVIGETVAGALSSPSLDEQSRITRDKLLDRLEQHLHDVNAFVRSRCLQIWLQLANAKAIPLPRLKAILPLVFGRTEDKSSNVRKNAVQLLTTVLAANPFAAKLNEKEFKSRLVAEEAKLKALLPPESRNVDDVTSKEGEGEEREREGGEGGGGEKEEGEKAGEVAKQLAVVKYLKDGVEFIDLMSSCVPVCTRLLGSKVNTDVLEALEFLAAAFEFQVQGSREGVKKALGLVWSQEQQMKDSLVETYVRLFLKPQSENPKQAVPIIVHNLMSLTNEATYAELSSLEQMMVLLMKGKNISAPVVKLLWDIFTKSVGNVTQSQSCSAVLLLSMIAGADPEIANANIRILISHGLKQHGDNPDLVLARHCCVMLQKLHRSHSQTNKPPVPFRFPHSHSMFQEITSLLVSQFSSPSSSQWTPFAEQAIAAIYRLSEQPDRLCGNILRSLVKTMSGVRGEGGEEGEGGEGEGEREDEETEGGRRVGQKKSKQREGGREKILSSPKILIR